MLTVAGLIVTVLMISSTQASVYNYAVRGFFMCGDKPMADAQVILYDENTALPDTVMQRDRTGPDGSFALQGESSSLITDIDPRLRIFHRCAQGDILPTACDREDIFELPQLNKYFKKDVWLEFGTFNVQCKPTAQKSSCVAAAAGAALTGSGSGHTADWISPGPTTPATTTTTGKSWFG